VLHPLWTSTASYLLEYVRAFDLGKLPPTIITDWAAPLLDGDLPPDVSIDVEPLDLAWRTVALEQIAGLLRMAYERRRTLPMRMTCTVVVRAPSRGTLEQRTKRLRQRAKDLVPSCGCCAGSSASAGWPCCPCAGGRWLIEACRSRQVQSRVRTRSRPALWPLRAECPLASPRLHRSRSPTAAPVTSTVTAAGMEPVELGGRHQKRENPS
jgi:hypothetical protein